MDQSTANPSGPKTVGKLTITVDRNLCIGAASCVAVAPKLLLWITKPRLLFLIPQGKTHRQLLLMQLSLVRWLR